MTWPEAFMLIGLFSVALAAYVAIEISRHRAIVKISELAAEADRSTRDGGRT